MCQEYVLPLERIIAQVVVRVDGQARAAQGLRKVRRPQPGQACFTAETRRHRGHAEVFCKKLCAGSASLRLRGEKGALQPITRDFTKTLKSSHVKIQPPEVMDLDHARQARLAPATPGELHAELQSMQAWYASKQQAGLEALQAALGAAAGAAATGNGRMEAGTGREGACVRGWRLRCQGQNAGPRPAGPARPETTHRQDRR
jgi:hypothetical protein